MRPNTRATAPIGLALIASMAAGMALLSATAAAAVPGAPAIAFPPSGADLVGDTVELAGTVAVDGTDQIVRVWVEDSDGISAGDCDDTVLGTESVFFCFVGPLADGDYTAYADAVEAGVAEPEASPPSPVIEFTIDSGLTTEITNWDGFNNEWDTFQPVMEGTGPALGSATVEVEVGSNTLDYCTASIDSSGGWSCAGDPLPVDYAYFTAYGEDAAGTASPPITTLQIGGYIEGAPPTVELDLLPAGVEATVTAQNGLAAYAEWYSVDINAEDDYEYGEPDAYCPPDAVGPDEASSSQEFCSFQNLPAGIWNLYAAQVSGGEGNAVFRDDYILIPETPTLAPVDTTPGSAVFRGTGGNPGDRVTVSTVGGAAVCSATVSSTLSWSCSADRPTGTAQYRAVAQSSGFVATPPQDFGPVTSYDGFSAYSSVRSATVPAPPAAIPPPAAPVIPAAPTLLQWTLLGVPEGPFLPGDSFVLSGTGLPDGAQVDAELRSTPRTLGSTTVQDGAFSLPVTVPLDMPPGPHTLVVTVVPQDGAAVPVSQPVVVLEASAAAEPPAEEPAPSADEPDGAGAGSGASGSPARSDAAAPSALTDAIPTVAEIFRSPIVTVTAGGIALAILLLVAFPTELLNSTLSSNTRRFGRGFARFESGVDRVTDWFAQVTRTRAVAAAVLILITSVIFGFVDPDFGFDPVSVRLTLALALGLFLVTYVASWISSAIIWRRWRIEASIGLQPAALIFAVLGVIVARLLDFSPGFLVGLVIGLEIVSRVGAPHRVRAVLTQLGVMVGISLLAWVGYSIVSESVTGDLDYGTALALDTLAAATAEGLTAAAVAILPLGFLEGREIFLRSKRLWVVSFLVIATLFCLLVLPTAAEGDDVGNIGAWMLVLVAFAVVTLTLWAALHFTDPDRHVRDEEEVDTEGAEPGGAERETAQR